MILIMILAALERLIYSQGEIRTEDLTASLLFLSLLRLYKPTKLY